MVIAKYPHLHSQFRRLHPHRWYPLPRKTLRDVFYLFLVPLTQFLIPFLGRDLGVNSPFCLVLSSQAQLQWDLLLRLGNFCLELL